LFHGDRQTYMKKLMVAFRNFANAPKKGYEYGVDKLSEEEEEEEEGAGLLRRKKKSISWRI